MNSANLQSVKILLIEDNPIDVDLTMESFEEARIVVDMKVASNGIEGFEILEKFFPDVILLDLNMPKMDGREFLREIKKHDEYKLIPVVVLTTSQANQDIIESYNLQASAFLSKPIRFDNFVQMMTKFNEFYLTLVKLPRREK